MNFIADKNFLFRYFSGNASDNEIEHLTKWLDENVHNREYFIRLKKEYIESLAGITGEDNSLEKAIERFRRNISEAEEKTKTKRKQKVLKLRHVIIKYSAAAILLVIIGTTAFFAGKGKKNKIDNAVCEIVVPYGGRSNIILPDGSKVWLNAGSKIRYNRNFDIISRDVYLEGEAYFDVEKKKYPFVVHTSHLDVEVLGTVFNVKSYPDDENIETTLVEGAIKIETSKEKKTILLKPKEKLTYRKIDAGSVVAPADEGGKESKTVEQTRQVKAVELNKEIELKQNVDTQESVSWTSGTLIINKESLESLAKKLERKFDVVFVFENENLKSYSYSGTLRDFPLEQVLHALKLTSPINYTIEGKKVRLHFNKNFKNGEKS
ncbi:MAG: FecR family protein [Bacteroidales bacterium]|nr:FecR family protein [Bacteroidales bacterium]